MRLIFSLQLTAMFVHYLNRHSSVFAHALLKLSSKRAWKRLHLWCMCVCECVCECSEGRIMCNWASSVICKKQRGGNRNQCWWNAAQGKLSTKWVFIKRVNNVKHKSTQIQHKCNTIKPAHFSPCVSLEVRQWITCLARIHFHYGLTFSRVCVIVWDVCVRVRVGQCVPECHSVMRMDMTVTGPSTNGAPGLPPLFLVSTCRGTQTNTKTQTHTQFCSI